LLPPQVIVPWIEEALDRPNALHVFDYYPLRAQYIITQRFGVEPVDARNAVQSLVQSPGRIIRATDTTILDAYEISAEKNHDVYDAFILALARSYDADYLLTTDADLNELCETEDVVSEPDASRETRCPNGHWRVNMTGSTAEELLAELHEIHDEFTTVRSLVDNGS
jgi:predicted nucleic acid-binding protein